MENEEEKVDAAQSGDKTKASQSIEPKQSAGTMDSHKLAHSEVVPTKVSFFRNHSTLPWMIATLVLLAALTYALIQPPFGDGKESVAEINGQSITKDMLYDSMVKAGGKQTLDNLINQEVIDQEAAKSKISVTDKDIQHEMDMIKKSFPDKEQFNQMLAQYGMTEATLKQELAPQVTLKKLLEPTIKVSDDDVKKYYEDNKAQFSTPEQVRASHILVKTKEEAQAILDELKGGADFAKLASEKSIDPGSKDKGGDLDYFARGAMTKPFEDVAFSLKNDELSGIVKSEFGFHIIKVVDHKQAVNATFETKKEEIRYQLVSQEVAKQSQPYLDKLKSKAKITNTLFPDEAGDKETKTTVNP